MPVYHPASICFSGIQVLAKRTPIAGLIFVSTGARSCWLRFARLVIDAFSHGQLNVAAESGGVQRSAAESGGVRRWLPQRRRQTRRGRSPIRELRSRRSSPPLTPLMLQCSPRCASLLLIAALQVSHSTFAVAADVRPRSKRRCFCFNALILPPFLELI
jgi:hypothetical protein